MARRIGFIALSVLLIVALLAIGGCKKDGDTTGDAKQTDTTADSTDTDDSTDDAATIVPTSKGDILMMGRSVMAGWFQHWGWNWDGAVERNGFTFAYAELAGPPELGSSAAEYIDGVPDGSIVFFKPCFVDFWAGSTGDVGANAAELIGYVDEVLAAAAGRNITVILGTGLPQVSSASNRYLVDAQQAYGEALYERAAENDNVVVFDLNSILIDDNGALKSEYAVSPDDSHLNDAAYDALDAEFFALLETLR